MHTPQGNPGDYWYLHPEENQEQVGLNQWTDAQLTQQVTDLQNPLINPQGASGGLLGGLGGLLSNPLVLIGGALLLMRRR